MEFENSENIMPHFLVLGAGFVAEPLVEYLQRNPQNKITIAAFTLAEAQQLADKFTQVKAMELDVSQAQKLERHLGHYDLIISLVPAFLHPLIAQVCIKQKVHLVTASYESEAMKELADEAKKAGIIILNEIGLDPGIDHLSAMQIIDSVHEKDEQVESFVSWCGGIPAPDDNDNPVAYKFSWEPRGALLALLNDACYLKNQQKVHVQGQDLMSCSQNITVQALDLQGYPNRNSLPYAAIYGIQSAQNILRGTLRYQGFTELFQVIKALKLMQTKPLVLSENTSWHDFILKLNECSCVQELQKGLPEKIIKTLEWLEIFSHDLHISVKQSALDVFCDLLLSKLSYQKGEKDMVVLLHKFVIKKANDQRYFIASLLKAIGEPEGYSAMAKTVGYPAAMASELIASNKISAKGLLLPMSPEFYQPILKMLKQEGICFNETIKTEQQMTVDQFLSELG